jgi:hypothetical protein
MADSTQGMTPGTEQCGFNQVWRGSPSVTSPTGTWLYVVDKLYARPSNGSAGWHVDSTGDYYYNGTGRPPVFDWIDMRTGQVGGQSALDTWTINPGWTVDILQFVWDNGVWYYTGGPGCVF